MNENENDVEYVTPAEELDEYEHIETRYLSVAQTAAKLGLSKMTVYRMVHKGDLRASKIGRKIRVFAPDVARLASPVYQPRD